MKPDLSRLPEGEWYIEETFGRIVIRTRQPFHPLYGVAKLFNTIATVASEPSQKNPQNRAIAEFIVWAHNEYVQEELNKKRVQLELSKKLESK